MNRSFASDIEGAILDQILNAARTTAGIAWKLTVSVLSVAIIVGMVAGPSARSEKPSLDEQAPVKVKGEGNKYRLFTQIPSDQGLLHLELVDPVGKQHLHLTYNRTGLSYFFTSRGERFQLGYTTTPGGEERASVRTTSADYTIDLQASGESGVVVVAPASPENVGEIWISPEGKIRPPRELRN
jgi:hypothetical protein